MLDESKKEVVKNSDINNKIKEESTQTLQVLMQKVMGGDNFAPTSQQFDEILAQRKVVHSYIHEERMQDHEKFKISSSDSKYYVTLILVFVIIICSFVLFLKPDYFTQVLSALLGFAGGFGVGKYKLVLTEKSD